MIKKITIILFMLFMMHGANSQMQFANDTSFRPSFKSIIREVDSAFHLETNNDFELRLWTIFSLSIDLQLIVLDRKDNKWNIRLFKRAHRNKGALIEVPLKNNNIDSLWNSLVKNHVLSLPDQRALKAKDGSEASIPIYDGISYCIELCTKDRRRGYSYHCPQASYKHFPYVKEYGWLINVIEALYQYCGLEPKVGC